ncbi:uncharacterized protein BDR25DRAFT_299433 [Lindgomyces ingoldianus]|uniref:Uncharacterized protein n=1 Tax=Lindgomyces ingoldianus TaxID=673940 RepID=A0ACB6REG8_9PLEO|nr:uncharacterized protein BDR25DRAFT_299433 [Lindgomyces ingoldianus]KAF2477512.1 hypothetical protein BDR25DRAFT_299433 [Lindgomyces ingoldianus]
MATLVYSITLYIAASAPYRHTLLGSVSAPLGNWFLTILAKAGDISFAFAVEDTVDTLTWRRLKEMRRIGGRGVFSGVNLGWFLALISSTGAEGLLRILRKSSRKFLPRNSAGVWSLVRLGFIFALIPGPGIILMASVPQRDVYFPVRTLDVSGGLALYDPGLASTYRSMSSVYTSRFAQNMLKDRSISWPMDPISESCKTNSSCTSYLLAGPSLTTAPWPFAFIEGDAADGFRLEDASFYQVDLWDPAPNTLTFSESRDCTLYGGLDSYYEFSMDICLAQQSPDGLLAAGWQSCIKGYAPNGTCLQPENARGWVTYLKFYRRKATITFSRSDTTIQEVRALSSPIPQQISPSQLFGSLNNVLYRPSHANESGNDIRYEGKSAQYQLTQLLGGTLFFSLAKPNAYALDFGISWLRNILTMPVYLFQPTAMAYANQSVSLGNVSDLEAPNLPAENYIKGSYCIVDHRAIPSWGVVVGYAIVAGFVLIFVWSGKLVATLWPAIETTEFPMLDYEVLTLLVDECGHEVPLRDRFTSQAYEETTVMDAMSDLRIGLREV